MPKIKVSIEEFKDNTTIANRHRINFMDDRVANIKPQNEFGKDYLENC